jgi:alkylation response protein AidB-like acyl-CoA dehydrogenase
MDYQLTEEQQMIRDLTRTIAEEKILPVRAELDETEEFPTEIMKIVAESDLFRVFVPEAYDGLGGGVLEECLIIEEISRVCGSVALSYAATLLGTIPILLFGDEDQKKKYLTKIAAGSLAAFGLTEAGAGSDASNMATTAIADGDDYILNGTKQWITNGGQADIYTIIAMTDKAKGSRGASAFVVEPGIDGFTFGKKEKKMGIRSSATTELIFDNCRVPKANLLGKEGLGFVIALKTLDLSRPGVAAQALGIAQGAFEAALKFANEREQGGQAVIQYQAVGHMLADMAMQIEAARALTYAVARTIDSGEKNYTKYASMAKCYASDVAMKVTTDAVQIMGGHGYMREYPVEKMMRDAKITQIYEGTNQIQRNVIAAALIKEAINK